MIEPLIHLASVSSRRRELLAQIGVHPNIVKIEVDETPKPDEAPSEYVIRLAIAKAEAGREATAGSNPLPVLAADTTVVVDNHILGKPKDREDALSMFNMLSGRTHKVLTGIALAGPHTTSRLSVSQVTFRTIDEREATAYWETGEPTDKAGGYGIQGLAALFISRLEGSYSGVMGLPLYETGELLRQAGIPLFAEPTQAGNL